MQFLKQSTASQSVVIGPFVDSTDGNTAETALTISNTDIRLSKNGANIVAKNSGGGTHDELGYYTITLDATDTNTVGRLQLMVHESGALPVYHEYQVLEEDIYDALIGTSAAGFDSSGAVTLAAATHTGAVIPTVSTLTGHTAQTGDSFARIGANGAGLTAIPWNAAWDAEVQSECTDALNAYDPPTRAELTSDIAGLNDLSAAQVNAEVDTALADIHLDHLLAVDYDPASKPGTATALLNELVESDAGVSRFTVNALENGPSGSGASAAAIADAVWDEAQADHVSAGSFGEVATEVANVLADTNELQTDWANGGRLDLILDAAATATALATAQTDLDTLTGSDGVTLATSQPNYAPATTSALATVDTEVGNIQTDVTAILADTAAIEPRVGLAVTVTFSSGGTTTTAVLNQVDGAAASSTDDVYNGGVLVFTAPAALKDQRTDITDYVGSTKTATITAVTASVGNTATAYLV